MKNNLIFLFIIFIISIVIGSCDNKSTNNNNPFSNIIETDGYGNLTGDIDEDYWSEFFPLLVRTYVGNKITISNIQIGFNINNLSNNLIIRNYNTEKLIVYFSISSPFTVNPDSIIILQNSQEEICLALPCIDSSEVLHEELVIASYEEDLITNHDSIFIEISAPYDGNYAEIPILYGVYPAYPNPTSGIILLPFLLKEPVCASLYIRNTVCDTVKVLTEEYYCGDIINEVIWDLTDSDGIAISSGIYEAVLELGQEETPLKWTIMVQ